MVPVTSSNIRAIGFDEGAGDLHIQFGSGLYIFADVPPEVHQAFLAAPSKGSHFAKHIRGKYGHRSKGGNTAPERLAPAEIEQSEFRPDDHVARVRSMVERWRATAEDPT